MSPIIRLLSGLALTALLSLSLAGVSPSSGAPADEGAPIQVSSGVSYALIGVWDVERLNRILTVDTPKFFGVKVAYTPARNGIKLYRITYELVIPERGNQPTVATGLLAVPDTGDSSFPMLSYQHGTVYGKNRSLPFPTVRRKPSSCSPSSPGRATW